MGEEYLYFFFLAQNWSGTPVIAEKDKADELKWFDKNQLPDNVVPYVKKVIEELGDGKIYSEHGFN